MELKVGDRIIGFDVSGDIMYTGTINKLYDNGNEATVTRDEDGYKGWVITKTNGSDKWGSDCCDGYIKKINAVVTNWKKELSKW